MYVTDYKTRERHLIQWDSENFSFDNLLTAICASYEYDITSNLELRLFHVGCDEHWEKRQRIDSMESLISLSNKLAAFRYNKQGTWYCFFGEETPQTSPGNSPSKSLQGFTKKHDTSDGSSTVTTDSNKETRDRYKQRLMRDRILVRDREICRVCRKNEGTMDCAHIIDVRVGLTARQLMAEFSLNDIYDHANGFFLCGTCNRSFDSFEFGITPLGDVIYPGSHKASNNIFVGFTPLDARSTKCLEWKYKCFLVATEQRVNKSSKFSISKIFKTMKLAF